MLNFDNDHLYEFFIARTERSRERLRFDDESGALYERTIDSLYPLPVKQHLYYLFDYGDCWIFKIAKVKLVKEQPDPRLMYPRIVSEAGNPPEQYPTTEE